MKNIILFISLNLISTTLFGAPCNGAPGIFYTNPDGSNGGFTQKGTWVEKTNYISVNSEICGKVIIRGNNIIEDSVINESVTIEGSSLVRDSQIFGFAKIKGRAIIQNSEICQGSIIEGVKVTNSKYYCQTEDLEPKDPGELNFKSLLGVDSDGDGVRDDIERFINKTISNTSTQNKAKERIASKILAKILQKEILLRNDLNILKSLYTERINLIECHNINFSDDIFLEMYDTKDRVMALMRIAGVTHGQEIGSFKRDCKELNDIDLRINNIVSNAR